ncbi:hypothetical protein SG34_031795 [Thalassomonas viridans]|uniref:Uncharacterized protein n=1 Tax=Thalassomonas viridans TaxID=137584 RepID=A0AAE9ZD22_9GAMM|nr:hypothetical protein [Thalassomonas viridans]WDE08507.1 hypothetical protein SG34_031795 [Thalassomonas viridans]
MSRFKQSSCLLRYDGNELKLFPGPEQFTSPNVDVVVEGQSGRLWIATLDNGLVLFDTRSARLTFFVNQYCPLLFSSCRFIVIIAP